ncbi:Putative SOS response-associated peptidase YedK [Dethiosulfatibacter aminovorans DSM 17477]|uniref:Abasic site processing protein n=1 Tax=Dethiosulfatibacter aminovorans DSM 17477 TaxID=1121476 RepID=A0A1M6F0L8_9FIRM|nr:SOS response-associated peptidase [Dethiosulfatibacter aminovorans]SHI91220.1 Putative SOS response-associated peptidase YedK [Dethiosulfatibacter aminovorans DSM 17477]
MCGRYLLSYDLEDLIKILEERWNIRQPNIDYYEPSYNIAPGQKIIALYKENNEVAAGSFRWGIEPSWSKNKSRLLINARSETVEEKSTFRDSYSNRRCLILTNGFYEWKRNGGKTPYYITLNEAGLFSYAGLWDYYNDNGIMKKACSILTMESNGSMSKIHNRMPVILNASQEKIWLSENYKDQDLLNPMDSSLLHIHEVSSYVNKWSNNSKKCIEPVVNEQISF